MKVIIIIVGVFLILKYISKLVYKARLTPTMKFILAANATTTFYLFKTCIDINCYKYSFLPKKFAKYLLSMGWGITNREETIEMIDWLFQEGHNKYFKEDVDQLDIEELKIIGFEKEQNILAWDLCRIIYICGGAYLGGYLKYRESIDYCVYTCKILQKSYTSWDDMMESYWRGVKYWEDDEEVNEFRLRYYEKLKKKKNGLYDISWNTNLDKNDIIGPRIF
nr:DUF1266 domain-containing protein [uncultured Tyzzerella sp.]